MLNACVCVDRPAEAATILFAGLLFGLNKHTNICVNIFRKKILKN
jgi:hypothetical protein